MATIQPGLARIMPEIGARTWKLFYAAKAQNWPMAKFQYKEIIGHIHTAGNPGRGELDDRQEINYPAVMRKLVDLGYTGYVGQEFIPTRDPLAGLRAAVQICNV